MTELQCMNDRPEAPRSFECPLVLIRWVDSRQPTPQWRYLAEVGEQKPLECGTVGWLIQDDAETKVVCQTIGDLNDPDNAQASGIMTIPARCVLSVERLSEVTSSSEATCGQDAA